LSASDPKRVVEAGYDAVAARYAEWSQNDVTGSPAARYIEKLLALLRPGAVVLDLGCDNGEPGARMLASGNSYTGVDISTEQLRRARELVPAADFVKADYTAFDVPAASIDAVVALYTFGHVPQAELPGLLARIGAWLRPGGHLLATMGSREHPDGVFDWLGVPMYFSGFDVDTNLRLVDDAGLDVLESEVVCQDEGDEGKPCFLWVLAGKRQDGPGRRRAAATRRRPNLSGSHRLPAS
jgi:cyclopropane fatty-acyl-phospholipid synthase-like methyltransferase